MFLTKTLKVKYLNESNPQMGSRFPSLVIVNSWCDLQTYRWVRLYFWPFAHFLTHPHPATVNFGVAVTRRFYKSSWVACCQDLIFYTDKRGKRESFSIFSSHRLRGLCSAGSFSVNHCLWLKIKSWHYYHCGSEKIQNI